MSAEPSHNSIQPEQSHAVESSIPDLSPVQQAARTYREKGYSVLPIRPLSKKPWLYSKLTYTRLPADPKLEAVFAGDNNVGVAVMAGAVSGNLFFIDCDSEDSFKHMITLCSPLGLYAVRSQRGGHLWFKCVDGELVNFHEGKLLNRRGNPIPATALKGNGVYVVAPPSVHSSGLCNYEIASCSTVTDPPEVSVSQLQEIISPHIRTTGGVREYCQATKNLIERGIDKGQRHNALRDCACDIVGCIQWNWTTPDKGRADFGQAAHACGLPESDRPNEVEQIWLWANSELRNPTITGRSSRRPAIEPCHAPGKLDNLRAWCREQAWPGQTGATDQRVFLALVDRAAFATDGVLRASIREVAQTAALSSKTAHRSIYRLIAAGHVALATHETPDGRSYRIRDKRSRANCYRLTVRVNTEKPGKKKAGAEKQCEVLGFTTLPRRSSSVVNSNTLEDLRERGGLGHNAIEIYALLSEALRSLTAREISEQLPMPLHRVRYSLSNKLKPHGLVENPTRGQWRAVHLSPEQWVRLAEKLGVKDKSKARRELFERERADHAMRLLIRERIAEDKNPPALADAVLKALAPHDPKYAKELRTRRLKRAARAFGNRPDKNMIVHLHAYMRIYRYIEQTGELPTPDMIEQWQELEQD